MAKPNAFVITEEGLQGDVALADEQSGPDRDPPADDARERGRPAAFAGPSTVRGVTASGVDESARRRTDDRIPGLARGGRPSGSRLRWTPRSPSRVAAFMGVIGALGAAISLVLLGAPNRSDKEAAPGHSLEARVQGNTAQALPIRQSKPVVEKPKRGGAKPARKRGKPRTQTADVRPSEPAQQSPSVAPAAARSPAVPARPEQSESFGIEG